MSKDEILRLVKERPGILQSAVKKLTATNTRMFLVLERDGIIRRELENRKGHRSFNLFWTGVEL